MVEAVVHNDMIVQGQSKEDEMTEKEALSQKRTKGDKIWKEKKSKREWHSMNRIG